MRAFNVVLRLTVVPVVLSSLVLSSCVDAPSAPQGADGPGELVIAPVLSLVGPDGPAKTQGQQDALGAAFDLVDRFHMVVRRAADNVVVLDTVIVVTPGQDAYDLTVPIEAKADEQFLITLTAMQGTTTLFTAENIAAKATPQGVAGSAPPAAVQIPLVYAGPGATAASVTVGPTQVVLAPGGSATVGSSVKDAGGAVVAGVPVSWATSASGVATVTPAGVVTGVGDGLATVTVTTPTGLSASATVYVVAGELAYVEGGALKVRGVAGGTPTDRASGGVSQPAWSADGAWLYYVVGSRVQRAGGGSLLDGSWPSVSPDGTKLAVERGGRVWFANDDGSGLTAGPSGAAPVWADGSTLLVGGGSVERVRADGTGRVTVVAGAASLAALASDGRIASLVGSELRVSGVGTALLTGATGRATWSPSGRWLVVGTGLGLVLVPSDGSAAAVALPGLGSASDPAFKPTGSLVSPPAVSVTGFSPDPPVPGRSVEVLGSGFDWIIRTNNRVIWPTRDGTQESAVGVVTEGSIATVMPLNVVAGQVRVETRTSLALMAFVPTVGSLQVVARSPWGAGVRGVGVALVGPSGSPSGVTDASGALVLDGLVPGTYTATLTAPTGWTLVGAAVRTLSIGADVVSLTLELTPQIATVVLSPGSAQLAVGQTLGVALVVTGVDGQPIPQVAGLAWRSLSPELGVTQGSGLAATLSATYAGEGSGTSVLEATVGGKAYSFPVTVTTSISGTVTKETGVSPAPPAPDVTVQVKRAGAVVGSSTTGSDGRYAVTGLFRGTYDVVPLGSADLLPVPAGQTVILDAANPSGSADFRMQSFAGLNVTARTPWDTPVAGVTVVLLATDSSEVARGQTTAEGTLSLTRVAAGTYTVKIAAPAGFTLTGDARRSVTLTPGPQQLALVVTPLIQTVLTIPEEISVEVGSTVHVELVAKDILGNVIPVQSALWSSGSAGLAVAGTNLMGTVGGVYPSPKDAPFELRVDLDGQPHAFPVSVTSFIEGLITKDPDLVGAPELAASASESPDAPPAGVAAGAVPAAAVKVTIRVQEGPNVGQFATNEVGRFAVAGLAQGTYEVVVAPQGGLSPLPPVQVVFLDPAHATGSVKVHMSRAAVDSIYVTVSSEEVHALGATTQLTVQAFDTAGAPLGGRTTTYASADPAVATVDAAGKVTAVTNGTVWIRATVESRTDSVRVTVDQKAVSLVLKDDEGAALPDSVGVLWGESHQLKWEARDARGNIIPPDYKRPTFMSSDATKVWVDTARVAHASTTYVGTADLTATMDDATDAVRVGVHGIRSGDLSMPGDLAVLADSLFGRINGSLYIVETSLANVDGLGTILEVMANVEVAYNPSLTNLNGLSNLRYVGGSVYFADNPVLSSSAIFPALIEIPGDLLVDRGAVIFGIPNLQTIGWSLVAWCGPECSNTVLQELRLPALLSAGAITIRSNDALTTVQLPLLQETTGALGEGVPPAPSRVRLFTPDLPDLDQALRAQAAQRHERSLAAEAERIRTLADVMGRRESERARSQERRDASRVRGMQLDLPEAGASDDRYQEHLAQRAAERNEDRTLHPKKAKPQKPTGPQLNGAPPGELSVDDNAVLTSLSFPALTGVSGDLYFGNNDALTSLGFPALTEVGGDFWIEYMDAMTSLTAPVLTGVGYDLAVGENPLLGQLVLPALRSVGNGVGVGYNPVMTQLKLPVLETTGDDIDIFNHEALSVIQIATGSTLDVGNALRMWFNGALTSVKIPGLASVYNTVVFCTNTINGSVVVGSAGPLEIGLGEEVEGDLLVEYHEGNFTFSAPGLVYVYDDIDVYSNPGLTSFTAATTGGPADVGYGIYFGENPVLATVSMPKVATVYDWIEFWGNPKLQSFNMAGLSSAYGLDLDENGSPDHPLTFSFPALESLEDDLELYGWTFNEGAPEAGPQLVLEPGDGVATLSLPLLAYVGGDVYIESNDILTTLSMPALQWVGGWVNLYYNPALASLSLPALVWTGGDIWVEENASLTTFGAPALESTAGPIDGLKASSPRLGSGPAPIIGGEVYIAQNPALTGFDLSALSQTKDVDVSYNGALVTLPALPQLSSGVSIYIEDNPSLVNLNGLAGVTQLYGVTIWANPSLTSVSGLSSLQEAWEVHINGNAKLTSLTLPGLVHVWNNFKIWNHTALTSIEAANLATVGAGTGASPTQGSVDIQTNSALTSVAFPALATVDQQVKVQANGILNLNGFSALKSPIYAVYVDHNPALTDVMGLSGIGTTFAAPAVAGPFQIQYNLSLCSDNVAGLIAAIQERGAGAFATPPVNSYNKACAAQQDD